MTVDGELRFGRCVLQPARRRLVRDGRALSVGARAFDLLVVLVEQRHRLVGKAELLDRVWPDVVVEEANLAVQVSTLRKLIGSAAIATVPGRGYRFVAPVDADATPPGPPEPGPSPGSAGQAPPTAPRPGSAPAFHVAELIGRDSDREALAAALAAAPLVTIVGPGGMGKTRLALAHARADVEKRRGGVCWVDLAALSEAGAVPAAVAQAAGVSLMAPQEADADAVARALAPRELLLVLDNVEHVVKAAADLARAVLGAAPGVRVLATGQVPLGVAGERVHRLQPLAVPPSGVPADETHAAVRLFIERARADNLRFTIADAAAADDVATICRALDGLPLAIELAATRVRLLGLAGVRERLDARLKLLAAVRGHGSDAPPRQQTLRATLEWSHALLARREQLVLQRLAPFVGGFTLALAQRAAADDTLDEWEVLDGLGVLVDRSIVAVDGDADPLRYRLPETMREFALERLAAAGETDDARRRHAEAVAAMFVEADEAAYGDAAAPEAAAQLPQQLRPDLDNARAALVWAQAAGHWPLAVALAGSAVPVYAHAGALHELLPTLAALRADVETAEPIAQVNLLSRLGSYGVQIGIGHAELLPIRIVAVERARHAGSRRRLQRALASLGFGRTRLGDEAGAAAIVGEMAALERPDDPAVFKLARLNVETALMEIRDDVPGVIAALQRQRELMRAAHVEQQPLIANDANLVLFLNAAGRHAEAAALGCELLARVPAAPPFAVAPTLYALAALGKVDAALALARGRPAVWTAAPIGVYAAEALGMLALARGRLADAVRIDGALERHRQAVGSRVHAGTRAFRAQLDRAAAAAGVSAAEQAAWREQGALLTDADAIARAVGD